MKRVFIFFFEIILILFLTDRKVVAQANLVLGADLSYVNEIEDCGGFFSDNGIRTDPFDLFKRNGASLVRVRLWHSPPWTSYSTYPDVEKTIRRAKEAGMKVLLDFHYSDDWADPQKQIIPAAWAEITDPEVLLDSIYQYTYTIIHRLDSRSLMPEMVQIGNEINSEILRQESNTPDDTINWARNIALLNKAIQAVLDASDSSDFIPGIMIHIAQPENALTWFEEAFKNHLSSFDIIGISYYAKWSEYSMSELYQAIEILKERFGKDIIVAETAYPWTMKNFDEAGNILGEDALVDGYPATPQGQYNYMVDLTRTVVRGGGIGVIYWEPAWISSPCKTRWGAGSHWENAAFFNPDEQNEVLPAIRFYSQKYTGPIQ